METLSYFLVLRCPLFAEDLHNEDGTVDFPSKNGGGQGQKTTRKVKERVEGDVFLLAGGFTGAPIAGLKSSNAPAAILNEAKQIAEYFKLGMDTAQSTEKAGGEVLKNNFGR